MKYTSSYRKAACKALGLAMAVAAVMAIQHGSALAQSSELQQSGTITINHGQIAFIFSANVGGGNLHYKGKTYPFSISGLGVGGFGISSIEATGVVYDLKKLSDFDGAYGQARTGIVFGTVSAGTLWRENSEGVYLRLKAKRKGIALALGADAIIIQFD